MKKIRAASVGLGWWSNELAKSIQGKSDLIEIVSCYSRNQSKTNAFAEEFDTNRHFSYEELLSDESIDAVILTTPHSLHAEHVIEAANSGKHVFVEKPFTLTYESARSAIKVCQDAKVVLAVGHNRRFATSSNELKLMSDAGDFGTMLHLEANFSASSAMAYTPEKWRANREESPAGGIAGLGIHLIDLMCWIAGPIKSVTALAKRRVLPVDIDDTTSVLFEFQSGMTGYLGCMFAAPYTTIFNIYGTKMNAFSDIDEDFFAAVTIEGKLYNNSLDKIDTLKAELDEFAKSCMGECTFRVTPAQAASNVSVMEAIAKSASLERKVRINSTLEKVW